MPAVAYGTGAGGLDALLRNPAVWRAGVGSRIVAQTVPSGFQALDRRLPGGGWPLGALTELLTQGGGSGEVAILIPALAALGAQRRWTVWIDPPYIPYAPALVARGIDLVRLLVVRSRASGQDVWSAEQALRSGLCGAVLLWAGDERRFRPRALRRLQLAAECGRAWGVIYRRPSAEHTASPAALRMRLDAVAEGLAVRVLKCRGRTPARPVHLSREELERG